MLRTVRTALTFPFAVLLACAGGASQGADGSSQPRPRRSDPRVLTTAEIDAAIAANVATLFDLVRAQRSQWLRVSASVGISGLRTDAAQPGSGSSAQAVVYVDRARLGGVEQMRQIRLVNVASARFLTPSEAQMEFGLDNLGGAIVVVSRGREQ
jgi:hypothetical protein